MTFSSQESDSSVPYEICKTSLHPTLQDHNTTQLQNMVPEAEHLKHCGSASAQQSQTGEYGVPSLSKTASQALNNATNSQLRSARGNSSTLYTTALPPGRAHDKKYCPPTMSIKSHRDSLCSKLPIRESNKLNESGDEPGVPNAGCSSQGVVQKDTTKPFTLNVSTKPARTAAGGEPHRATNRNITRKPSCTTLQLESNGTKRHLHTDDLTSEGVTSPLTNDHKQLKTSTPLSQRRRSSSLDQNLSAPLRKKARTNTTKTVSLKKHVPLFTDSLSSIDHATDDERMSIRAHDASAAGDIHKNITSSSFEKKDNIHLALLADGKTRALISQSDVKNSGAQNKNRTNLTRNYAMETQGSRREAIGKQAGKNDRRAQKVKINLESVTYYPACDSTYDSVFGYGKTAKRSKLRAAARQGPLSQMQRDKSVSAKTNKDTRAPPNIADRTRGRERARRDSLSTYRSRTLP